MNNILNSGLRFINMLQTREIYKLGKSIFIRYITFECWIINKDVEVKNTDIL